MDKGAVKRIAIFGPPLSGKVTILENAKIKYSGEMYLFRMPLESNPDLAFPFVFVQLRFQGRPIEIFTIPGSPGEITAWSQLLPRATDLIFVVDPQITRVESLLEHSVFLLRKRVAAPVRAVQVTKGDLLEAAIECLDVTRLRSMEKFSAPLFVSRIDRPETLCSAVDYLLGDELRP